MCRLYIATGQETYKKAAYDYYMKHYKEEDGPGVWDNFDWDSHSWAAVVLLQRWVECLSITLQGVIVCFHAVQQAVNQP
jgi:hypothetical protein